jgi:hypothetical protein
MRTGMRCVLTRLVLVAALLLALAATASAESGPAATGD